MIFILKLIMSSKNNFVYSSNDNKEVLDLIPNFTKLNELPNFEEAQEINTSSEFISEPVNIKNLDYLIIDCFRPIKKTYTHLNYEESINLIKNLRPKKAILTNMHVDLDYKRLKESLPKNIVPAYDNLRFNF